MSLHRALIAVALVGCSFKASATSDAKLADAMRDSGHDAPLPDAGPCSTVSVECLADGDTLRACAMAGGSATDTTCAWGCLGSDAFESTAHCAELVPTGSAAQPGDLGSADLGSAVTIPDGTTINQMDGTIPGIRAGGTGVKNGIDFETRNGIGVFRFNGLTIAGTVHFMVPGPAVVFVSSADLTVDGALDLQDGCSGGKGGPGGFAAGPGHTSAVGSGGGSGGAPGDPSEGGGGGGYGAAGGSGGDGTGVAGPSGGSAFGDPLIGKLVGGGGGGGGGAGGNNFGGGGGGAIQLVANGQIMVTANGSINAGGCGGISGDTSGAGNSGGAGGAGGAILLEAHDIALAGELAVNGGGGGAGDVPGGNQGANAGLGRIAAAGSTLTSSSGGNGGFAGSLTGSAGTAGGTFGGGGGGGVGRMRFNTRAGSASVDNTQLSPALTDTPTTCTQGVAATQ